MHDPDNRLGPLHAQLAVALGRVDDLATAVEQATANVDNARLAMTHAVTAAASNARVIGRLNYDITTITTDLDAMSRASRDTRRFDTV
jgi:hypothetical protein